MDTLGKTRRDIGRGRLLPIRRHAAFSGQGARSLLDTLREDPEGQLGGGARGRFGDTLPFLVKVLAADEPLSLQAAHPSAQQAVEGFGREERQGIPVSSPVRNYRDRGHKPELLVARGQFKALAGFRSGARSVELLRALRVSNLDHSSGCCMTSPKPTVCAHCSPPGSPRRSRTSMCWCPR